MESAACAIPRLVSPFLNLQLVVRQGLIHNKIWEEDEPEEETYEDEDDDAKL